MACIIKLTSNGSKGVITFTDGERDNLICKNNELKEKIKELKKNWVIGIHHNWHNDNFKYDPFFDFHLAGTEYLKSADGKPFPQIPMAATNFAPDLFEQSPNEKFWDMICTGRAVKFKKIPELFATVRKLYDDGKKYRFLFICSIPPYKWSSRRTSFYDIRKVYNNMFTQEEQDLFTLLTTTYRDPFPFDQPTIANFYKSSRIFVYFADNERQGRVVGNAFASGMPVVGMDCIASPLPKELQTKPYFYLAKSYNEFPKLIEEAIEDNKKNGKQINWEIMRMHFSETYTKKKLDSELEKLFNSMKLKYENTNLIFSNLSLRLCRHNNLYADNSNERSNLKMPLEQLIDILNNKPELALKLNQETDPEKAIEDWVEIEKEGYWKRNTIKSIFVEFIEAIKREVRYLRMDLGSLLKK